MRSTYYKYVRGCVNGWREVGLKNCRWNFIQIFRRFFFRRGLFIFDKGALKIADER